MSSRSLRSVPAKRKVSDNMPDLMLAQRQRTPGHTEHSDIRAIIITYKEHDLIGEDLQAEMETVIHFFEECLGVQKCVQLSIPAWVYDAGKYVRSRIKKFKDDAADEGVLNLVYHAGHGGQRPGGRNLSATSGTGQSFDWNSLQWDCIFTGKNDTLVFLDCCFAGASFRCSLHGCKDNFGACSASSTTAGPGENSFSDLFVRAGWTLSQEDFTLEDWLYETAELANEKGCVSPVSQSFGSSQYQILFQPSVWMARKRLKELKEATRKEERQIQKRRRAKKRRNRVQKITSILDGIWELQDLDSDDFPGSDEIDGIETNPSQIEPFTSIGIYRAWRRFRDGEVEACLLSEGL